MHATLRAKLNEQVPRIVEELIAVHCSKTITTYGLHIEEWSISPSSGCRVVTGFSRYSVDEDDFLDHLKKANSLNDATITIKSTNVVVERVKHDGMRGVTAIYFPEVE